MTEIKDACGHSRHFEYDPMDRVATDTDENGVRRTHEYDARENLIKYTDGLGNSEKYVYDKNGNLTGRTDRNGNATGYTLDGCGNIVTVTDAAGHLVQKDEFDTKGIQRTVTGYTYDAAGNRTGIKECKPQKPQEDYQSSTDGTWGEVQEDKDVWGAVQESRGYLNDNKTTVIKPIFTGHSYDSILGIYFADARFYDAGNRQWMSMDPIKDGGNWYQYCYSSPATYVDPLGLEGFSPFGCGLNELKSQFDKACGDIKDWARQVDCG